MESARLEIPHPPPPSPRMESPAAEEERRPRQRPRAREVSSRYMLASPASNVAFTYANAASLGPSLSEPRTNADAPLPPPPPKKLPIKQTGPQFHQKQHARPHQSRRSPSPLLERRRPPVASSPEVSDSESDGCFFSDENRLVSTRLSRSSDTPLPTVLGQAKPGTEKRRTVLRLFGENREDRQHGKFADDGGQARENDGRPPQRKGRLGTPVVGYQERTAATAATPRIGSGSRIGTRRATAPTPPSRPALPSGFGASEFPRLTAESVGGNPSIGASSSENSNIAHADLSELETSSHGSQEGWCESTKIRVAQRTINRNRGTTECRSSMSDADRISGKSQADLASSSGAEAGDGGGNCRGVSSLCNRSLNSALSSCTFQSQLSAMRAAAAQQQKAALEAKKGGKKGAASRQEDMHALRMTHNQYLQWKFINAKAQVVEKVRTSTATKSFHAVATKLSLLRDSVSAKRAELERLKNLKRLSSILDAQMPYLAKWSTLEGDFSQSLTGANEALQDASTRVPLVENVKADVQKLSEVLNSALKLTESFSPQVGSFLSHVEGVDNVACDLASVATMEHALIGECGRLLSEVQQLQVKECSLRSQIMQSRHRATSLPNKTD